MCPGRRDSVERTLLRGTGWDERSLQVCIRQFSMPTALGREPGAAGVNCAARRSACAVAPPATSFCWHWKRICPKVLGVCFCCSYTGMARVLGPGRHLLSDCIVARSTVLPPVLLPVQTIVFRIKLRCPPLAEGVYVGYFSRPLSPTLRRCRVTHNALHSPECIRRALTGIF